MESVTLLAMKIAHHRGRPLKDFVQETAGRIAAHDARLLNEAAERGATWLLDQTSNIDPAIAATNSGKWLIKLREKQTAGLRAAIKGAAHE